MPIHDQFEELCALAAAGEISAPDTKILEAHVAECASCRDVLADLEEIHSQWLPTDPRSESGPPSHADWRLRQRILKGASSEGARFSDAALASPFAPRPLLIGSRQLLAMAALILLSVSIGVLVGNRRTHSAEVDRVRSAKLVEARENSLGSGPQLDTRVDQSAELSTRLSNQLEMSRKQTAVLLRRLEDTQAALTQYRDANAESQMALDNLRQQLRDAESRATSLTDELAKLKTTDEVVARVQESEIDQLNEKLRTASLSLDREREMLSAGREIRDLIAARNLHIIDVYDTNSEGKTSPAFGRVFYTEGKSLVFYAYDLNGHPENAAKFAFYVWGKRDGAPQIVKSLGRMSKDDRAQKRWALTITDPKVLAEIDSVFITLEPAEMKAAKPSGKPLLSAFLGTAPNHP